MHKHSKPNQGHFRKGHDPRRHPLTREERQRGFWNALQSITECYPEAVSSGGTHMAHNFLRVKNRRRKQR